MARQKMDFYDLQYYNEAVSMLRDLSERYDNESVIRVGLIKLGFAVGEKKGLIEGEREAIFDSIVNLMSSSNVSSEEAMKMLKIDKEDYEVYQEMLEVMGI